MLNSLTLSQRKSDLSSPFKADFNLTLENDFNIFSQQTAPAAKEEKSFTPAKETRNIQTKKVNKFEKLIKSSPLIGASESGISMWA